MSQEFNMLDALSQTAGYAAEYLPQYYAQKTAMRNQQNNQELMRRKAIAELLARETAQGESSRHNAAMEGIAANRLDFNMKQAMADLEMRKYGVDEATRRMSESETRREKFQSGRDSLNRLMEQYKIEEGKKRRNSFIERLDWIEKRFGADFLRDYLKKNNWENIFDNLDSIDNKTNYINPQVPATSDSGMTLEQELELRRSLKRQYTGQ